jgi:hypothetical protein
MVTNVRRKGLGKAITVCAVALTAIACFIYVLAQRSRQTALPHEEAVSSTQPKEIALAPGGDLQAALKNAKPGDTIILQAGATYPGPLTLPNKAGSDYITIRTSGLSGIPKESERVEPARHAQAMPKIVAPTEQPAIRTDNGAHHYKFTGIEFSPADNARYVYNLIDLGRSDNTTTSQSPHHLVFDRCYVHSTGLNKVRRGFALNSGETSILNSYVAGFAGDGDETQAIAGWNGPGPFHIINNYLEAGAEIVLFGGADPLIPNLIPSDIEIRRNHLFRPATWAGKATIKGNFELKNARRVVVDANVIDSPIRQTAFVLTVRNQEGKAPWSTLEDIEITNNIVNHASTGVNLLGSDTYHPSATASRIRIANNLFMDIVSPGDVAYFLQINGGHAIIVEQNTIQQAGNIISSERPAMGLVFRNNIVQYNQYGMACFIQGPPCQTHMACRCFPDALIKGNVIADNAGVGTSYPLDQNFPPGNVFVLSYDKVGFVDYGRGNWRLAASSKIRGRATDGRDPGVDFSTFEASGVEQVVLATER